MSFRHLASGEKLIWEEELWNRQGRKDSDDRGGNSPFLMFCARKCKGPEPLCSISRRYVGTGLGINNSTGSATAFLEQAAVAIISWHQTIQCSCGPLVPRIPFNLILKD